MANHTAPSRAERNGHRRVIRLGDTTPDRALVEINGRELEAWVISEQGYPQSLAAELDAAQQAYLRSREELDPLPTAEVLERSLDLANAVLNGDTADLHDLAEEVTKLVTANMTTRRFQTNPVTWEHYVTKAIMLLAPGITYEEADTLTPKARNDLLVDLGYFQPAPEADVQATGGVDQRPPAQTPTSTGETPEPASVTSTPA